MTRNSNRYDCKQKGCYSKAEAYSSAIRAIPAADAATAIFAEPSKKNKGQTLSLDLKNVGTPDQYYAASPAQGHLMGHFASGMFLAYDLYTEKLPK